MFLVVLFVAFLFSFFGGKVQVKGVVRVQSPFVETNKTTRHCFSKFVSPFWRDLFGKNECWGLGVDDGAE